MSEDATRQPDPSPLPDLSLYSTPDLAMALIRELRVRHRQDCLAILIERDDDGDEPVRFERFVGPASRLEGMVGGAYRHVKRLNNKGMGRWRGDRAASGE